MANQADGAECVVSGPLAVALRWSRLMGLAPLRFHKHERDWRIQISSTYTICGYVIVAIVNVFIVYTMVKGIQLNQSNCSNPIEVIAYTMEAIIVTFTASSMVYNARTRMQCVIDTCNRAEQVKALIKIQPWPVACSTKILRLFLFWIALSLTTTIFDVMLSLATGMDITYEVWFVLMRCMKYSFDWCIQLSIYQFTFLVLYVKSCFVAVNESIAHLLMHEFKEKQQKEDVVLLGDNISQNVNNKFRDINMTVDSMKWSKSRDSGANPDRITPGPSQDSVRRLFTAYASASGMVRDIDRAHGLTLILVLAVTFLRLVFKPYYFINNLFIGSASYPIVIYHKFSPLYWSLFHLVNLVTIVEPCHLSQMEMLRTHELVCRLSRRVEQLDPLAVDLEQFCKYLALYQVTYRPLNITTISRRLILTILGNITTYLVLIVDIQ